MATRDRTQEEGPVYLLRPDNTSLWLPPDLAHLLGLTRGARLTPAQFQHPAIGEFLEAHSR